MISLIKFLILGHVHKWKIINTLKYEETFGPDYGHELNGLVKSTGTRYHLQCEKCGIVMKKDLI